MSFLSVFASRPMVIAMSAGGTIMLGHYVTRSYVNGSAPNMPDSLQGQMFVVTGCSSGLGKEMVNLLAAKHARVVMANRDYDQCTVQRRDLVSKSGNKQLHCRKCDLGDFETVRRAAEWMIRTRLADQPISCLILNAAVKRPNRVVTPEGVELTLGVNHQGHFLLTNLLIDKMLAQGTPSRIVVVDCDGASSSGSIDFEDLNKDKDYHYLDAYKQSKYANLSFAYELARRCEGTNVSVVTVSPGLMVRQTQLDRKLPYMQNFLSRFFVGRVGSYFTGRDVNAAYKYVLDVALSEDVKNGDRFVGADKVPYPESVLEHRARLRLWLTDEKWTQLDKQRQQMYKELLEAQQRPANTDNPAASALKALKPNDLQWVKQQFKTAQEQFSGSLTAMKENVSTGGTSAVAGGTASWYRFW